MMKQTPSQRELLETFLYDSETGKLFWLPRVGENVAQFNGKLAGKEAGTTHNGYVVIKLDGVPYKAHRLIWKIVTGNDLAGCADHIDRDPLNNRFENLRDVSFEQNSWNTKLRAGNVIGFRGVSFQKKLGKWIARIRVGGSQKFLGVFDSPELAHAAFVSASLLYRDEYAMVA